MALCSLQSKIQLLGLLHVAPQGCLLMTLLQPLLSCIGLPLYQPNKSAFRLWDRVNPFIRAISLARNCLLSFLSTSYSWKLNPAFPDLQSNYTSLSCVPRMLDVALVRQLSLLMYMCHVLSVFERPWFTQLIFSHPQGDLSWGARLCAFNVCMSTSCWERQKEVERRGKQKQRKERRREEEEVE